MKKAYITPAVNVVNLVAREDVLIGTSTGDPEMGSNKKESWKSNGNNGIWENMEK